MNKMFLTALSLAALGTVHSARALVLFESVPDQSAGFAAFANAGSTVVGRLTVSNAETIGGIGVLNNLENGANLKFFIADATTGAFLYISAPKAFAAETGQNLNLTYKVSDGLSFTFLPGTTYAVGSIADDVSYTFIDPFQTNTAVGFTSLSGNLTVSGYAAPVLDAATNCCSVGFELLDAPQAVPEPGSFIVLAAGVVGLGVARSRRD
jgi:hypothetical protein